jgi:uncharacterized membrane protein SpoIIM required for sporulation
MAAREDFIADRKPRWDRLDRLLILGSPDGEEWAELASLYRATAADLARAQALGLGDDVLHYLDELALRAHNKLYGVREVGGLRLIELVTREVPREVRASWRWFLASTLLFYVPFLFGLVGSLLDPRFAPTVLPPEQLAQMEQMYASPELVRAAGEDFAMAGFYVFNNVGIAFRCFATGILGGLGSIFFLVYNGLVIGTVFGHLGTVGSLGNILAFTSGHSAWELTGIVLSGAAGLRMGWAVVETNGRTRVGSLRAAGPTLFRLIVGAAAMLFVAAAIEGFWSAGPVPPIGKYVFGILQIVIVAGWLLFGGRKP